MVRVDRPAPGEELNEGPVSPARQAASVILLRDEPALEVLLVERNPQARFMGGAWVFPGGSVHADDGGHAGGALRELEEEAGIALAGPGSLIPFSRWITPAQVKVRFDTTFFVAAAPPEAVPSVDGAECVDARWTEPPAALAAYARGELMLVFPTIKHLEELSRYGSTAEVIAAARERRVEPVQPQIVVGEGFPRVVLPGEPGFDEARGQPR